MRGFCRVACGWCIIFFMYSSSLMKIQYKPCHTSCCLCGPRAWHYYLDTTACPAKLQISLPFKAMVDGGRVSGAINFHWGQRFDLIDDRLKYNMIQFGGNAAPIPVHEV